MMKAFEKQRFSDRRDAVGPGSADFGFLNRFVKGVGFLASNLLGIAASADLCSFADLLCDSGTDSGKRGRQKPRHRRRRGVLQHGDQLSEFDAIWVWLDLYGFRRKLSCGARIRDLAAIGIDIVNRHMWIGDGRLFQIFVHTATPALVTSFELDRDTCAAAHFVLLTSQLIRNGVVRYPFDTMGSDVLLAFFTGWNVFAVTFAVDYFRHVPASLAKSWKRSLPVCP